jgi:hypothetical protein
MALSLPHTFASKTIVSGSELDEQFAAVQNKFAAGIASGDLNASAGILLSQIEASYEHMDIMLEYLMDSGAAGWPAAATVLDYKPLYGDNTHTNWVVTGVQWMCNDTGAGTGTFDIDWGYFDDATGAWASVASLFSAAKAIANPTAGANNPNQKEEALASATVPLTFGAQPRMLRLFSNNADGTCMSTAGDFFRAVVRLRRPISST